MFIIIFLIGFNRIMTDIAVIPQNIDTCWFNSILTVSLFSQRTSPIIYEALKEFYKKDKSSIISIFKYIHKNKPNREYYNKIRAELLLFKFLKKYDNTTYNAIKDRIHTTGTTLYYHNYIYAFYRILNVQFNHIIYDYKNNKFYKNFFDKNYIKNAEILIFIYYNKYISDDEEEIEHIDLKNEIIYDGINYILDNSLISNKIENHSIAGITYNNERYLYNGQSECNLYKFDWDINKNQNFIMNNCKLYLDDYEDDEDDNNYNFNYNNSYKILIYVKKTEDELMTLYSKSETKKEISNIKSIVENVYDYYNIFDKIENDIDMIDDIAVLTELRDKFNLIDIDIYDSKFKEVLKDKIEELLNKIYMNISAIKQNDYRFLYDDNKDLLTNIKKFLNYEFKLEKKKLYLYNINIKFNNIINDEFNMIQLANNIYELLNVKLKIPFNIMYFSDKKLSRYELINIIKAKIKTRIIKNNNSINNIYHIVMLYASYINNDTNDFDYALLFDKSLNEYRSKRVKYYNKNYIILDTYKSHINHNDIYKQFREKYDKYFKSKKRSLSSSSSSSASSEIIDLSKGYNPSQLEPEELLINYFNDFIIDFILDKVLFYDIKNKDLKPPTYLTKKLIKKYNIRSTYKNKKNNVLIIK